jgi:hypothetical protein
MTKTTTKTSAIRLQRRIKSNAKDFATWLNSTGEQQELFRKLVDLTVAATKHEQQRKRATLVLYPSDPYLSYEKKFNRLMRRIDKHPPPTRLQMVDWGHEKDRLPLFGNVAIRPMGRKREDLEVRLHWFGFLAEHGVFADFCRCALPACGKGFFALRRKRRYCSDECQRAHYNQSDERKKDNLEYQKQHYHKWLSAEAKRMQKLAARRGLNAKLPLSDLKKLLKGR